MKIGFKPHHLVYLSFDYDVFRETNWVNEKHTQQVYEWYSKGYYKEYKVPIAPNHSRVKLPLRTANILAHELDNVILYRTVNHAGVEALFKMDGDGPAKLLHIKDFDPFWYAPGKIPDLRSKDYSIIAFKFSNFKMYPVQQSYKEEMDRQRFGEAHNSNDERRIIKNTKNL